MIYCVRYTLSKYMFLYIFTLLVSKITVLGSKRGLRFYVKHFTVIKLWTLINTKIWLKTKIKFITKNYLIMCVCIQKLRSFLIQTSMYRSLNADASLIYCTSKHRWKKRCKPNGNAFQCATFVKFVHYFYFWFFSAWCVVIFFHFSWRWN